MAEHLETGQLGENLAQRHLLARGYQIIETNWRHRRNEIDIIAIKDNILVFIEVKTRGSDKWGHPAEFLSRNQEMRIATAAAAYMEQIQYERAIRFDLVAITLGYENDFKLEHFEDAFFPGSH